jgi:hypothetical protein
MTQKQANIAAALAKLGPQLAGGLNNVGTMLTKKLPAMAERGLNRYGELLSGSRVNRLDEAVHNLRTRGPSYTTDPAIMGPRQVKWDKARGYAEGQLRNEKGLSALTQIGTGVGGAELASRALTGNGLASMNRTVGIPDMKLGGKEAAAIASLTPLQQLVFHKQASERVSFHFANMIKLSMAMREFDVDLLCKHAAVGLDRASRLKYAALAVRYQQEKEAFAAVLPLLRGALQMGGGVGKGLLTAGGGVAKGLGQAASGIGSGALEAAKALTPAAKGTGSAALKGLRGLAKGVSNATGAYGNFLQRNPRVGGATSAALGVGAGLAAPRVARAYGGAQDTMAGIGEGVGSAVQGVRNFGDNAARAIRSVTNPPNAPLQPEAQ